MTFKRPYNFKVIKRGKRYACEVYFYIGKEKWTKNNFNEFDTEADAKIAGELVLSAVRTLKREYDKHNSK